MLTLTFLGVGSAFAKRNFHSNALVEVWSHDPLHQKCPDATLLIDFGGTGPLALYELKDMPEFSYLNHNGKIHYPAIGHVFVTHVHADHAGGLEELAVQCQVATKVSPNHSRPKLLGSPEVLELLWNGTLRGGLGVFAGRRFELEDFFKPCPLSPDSGIGSNGFLLSEHYQVSPFRTDHIRLNTKYDWPSCGLMLRDLRTQETVVYSGDARFDFEGMGSMFNAAKLIFHDVQLDEEPGAVHALLSDLASLPTPIRKRMILYHLADSWDSPAFAWVEKEFRGFAKSRHRYILFP